jgi:exonuclease SbcD
MIILHTADWHLGDRLGRIDRTIELQTAVERIAGYCAEHVVDVLLIAGDLFSELSRPDCLRASIEHLAKTFQSFLLDGGSILALTGNHDNENFCRTLVNVMNLAAPADVAPGQVLPGGRMYLATGPALWRLADRQDKMVQFVMLPYPTAGHYLDDRSQRYASLEEKNRALHAACIMKLQRIQTHAEFDSGLPTVLAAHLHVQGAKLPGLSWMTEQESIVLDVQELPLDWDYIALGHIHQAQEMAGRPHVRYSGSIARLDLGEWKDRKSVVLVEVGNGARRPPALLPLPARPIYEVMIDNPKSQLPTLSQRYPDAGEALVRYHVTYEAGRDILNEVLAEMDRVFPNWYDRSWSEAGQLAYAEKNREPERESNFRTTVLEYLEQQLQESRDRHEVIELAETLLASEGLSQ